MYDELRVDGQSHKMDAHTKGCKRIWSACFLLGLSDAAAAFKAHMEAKAKAKDPSKIRELSHEALRWLNSDLSEPGSFAWLCELHDMEPQRVRNAWRLNVQELVRQAEAKGASKLKMKRKGRENK